MTRRFWDKVQIEWTEQMVDDMIDQIIDNKSMEETANFLSKKYRITISRNAVIGKWRRFVFTRFGGPQ